jgi:DNA modification methylase
MSEPYYKDASVELWHDDCLDVLPRISGVDVIITSPPYNLGTSPGAGGFGHYRDGQSSGGGKGAKWTGVRGAGIEYDDHADSLPWPEYEAWQRTVLDACWDTLSDTGAIYYNHKPRIQKDTLWTPLVLNPGLPLRQIITWARAGGMGFSEAAYVSTSEWIMVLAKPAFRLKSKAASGLGDVWRIPQQGNPDHPAPFPLSLPAGVIETTAPRLVMDPFAGSGTTLRAAKDAGVRSIGIEISERYCEIAARRLTQDTLFGATEEPA